ncbi:MAG: N-6 DNA methylase [Oscillospiraceae bacterium]|nr:N-6 DNA methylase [Oscillospiraceae bacterium]
MRLEKDVFMILLLIRYLSETYPLPLHQFTFEEIVDKSTIGITPWDLLERKAGDSYATALVNAMTILEPKFPFVRVFIDENKHHEVDESTMQELIDLLSAFPADQAFLSSLFEDFMCKELPVFSKATSGDFYTPREIVRCIGTLLDMKGGTLYDPCCGSGAMLIGAAQIASQHSDLTCYGQTQDVNDYKVCCVNFVLHGLAPNLGNQSTNTLTSDQHMDQIFDYILANPPFNLSNENEGYTNFMDQKWHHDSSPKRSGNFAWVQHILRHLKENGRAAVLLPNRTLTSRRNYENHIRKQLICDGAVEAIITFPAGLFCGTKIPFCAWLLNRPQKRSKILIIDATRLEPKIEKAITAESSKKIEKLVNGYREGTLRGRTEEYAVVDLEELAQKDYILSPNWFTVPRSVNLTTMRANSEHLNACIKELQMLFVGKEIFSHIKQWERADMASVWAKVALLDLYKVFGGLAKSKESFGQGRPALDMKTIIRHPFIPDNLSLYVQATEAEAQKHSIKCGDVLLNRTSETIEELACCCVSTKDTEAVYTSFTKRLRPICKQTIYPLYAAGYFQSKAYRLEIERASTVFTTRASIDNAELSRVSVYYPDWNMQYKIGDTLFAFFQYRQNNPDAGHHTLLTEFERLLIEQYISYPIAYFLDNGGLAGE